MKIAYIVHDYHRAGGHSRYVAELATRFAGHHEVHVFANRIYGPDKGIHFHIVPAWRLNALTTVLSFALPVTFQVGSGFDVIHCQGFCGFVGNVFTAHMCNRAWHLALQKLEVKLPRRTQIFNAVASLLEYGLYRSVHNSEVIAVSEKVARDIAALYQCRAPIRVIHHGVDLQLFSPAGSGRWRSTTRAQLGLPEQDMLFLYVGDLRKGARCCIEALARLDRGRLILVSRSDPESYRRIAERCGQAERVHFAGPTNEIEKMYAAADALLLPTPYDTFGMVVSEAMACALPVIVSREAGASELIEHGVNGLVLQDFTDEAELAGHMASLEAHREYAVKLGTAGRATVERLSWDSVAEKTMCVYQELLNKRGRLVAGAAWQ